MSNLLSGLEKFGLGDLGELNILDDGSKNSKAEDSNAKKEAAPIVYEEKDFLMDKKIKCACCDQEFLVRSVTNTRLKRLEADFDLRPNFEYIDTLKYDVLSCPHCGYTAMISTFPMLEPARRKLIKQEICANFKPQREPYMVTYEYEYAIEKFKLSLVCCIAKRGKLSEKAYNCLKIAWLRRAQIKQFEELGNVDELTMEDAKQEMEGFYKQAFEGFTKALETETPPYCGMDSITVEFMLANMALHFKKYDIAAKLTSRLLTSPNVNKKMKDKLQDLKDQIVAEAKKSQS